MQDIAWRPRNWKTKHGRKHYSPPAATAMRIKIGFGISAVWRITDWPFPERGAFVRIIEQPLAKHHFSQIAVASWEVVMALAAVTLDDKYVLDQGRVYLTGTQALVRLPMMQRQRDIAAGLNTGCFISGYRGSPLGGFDQALWSARRFIEKSNIHFQPAINEELGATAVWGSQQDRSLSRF